MHKSHPLISLFHLDRAYTNCLHTHKFSLVNTSGVERIMQGVLSTEKLCPCQNILPSSLFLTLHLYFTLSHTSFPPLHYTLLTSSFSSCFLFFSSVALPILPPHCHSQSHRKARVRSATSQLSFLSISSACKKTDSVNDFRPFKGPPQGSISLLLHISEWAVIALLWL